MPEWTNEELQAVIAEVARRSTIDPDFRALALKDAAAAISMVGGRPAPKDQSFRFVESSGDQKVIALPDPVPDLEELSEAELVAIAGGDVRVGTDFKYTPSGPSGAGAVTWSR
jgi:hypothetical protein